jgi:hypothetical protein
MDNGVVDSSSFLGTPVYTKQKIVRQEKPVDFTLCCLFIFISFKFYKRSHRWKSFFLIGTIEYISFKFYLTSNSGLVMFGSNKTYVQSELEGCADILT